MGVTGSFFTFFIARKYLNSGPSAHFHPYFWTGFFTSSKKIISIKSSFNAHWIQWWEKTPKICPRESSRLPYFLIPANAICGSVIISVSLDYPKLQLMINSRFLSLKVFMLWKDICVWRLPKSGRDHYSLPTQLLSIPTCPIFVVIAAPVIFFALSAKKRGVADPQQYHSR